LGFIAEGIGLLFAGMWLKSDLKDKISVDNTDREPQGESIN
jgi:hypothetical protein